MTHRAAESLWGESLYEYLTVDVSSDMGDLARALRVGGDAENPTTELIKGVHFRQYLPLSNKVAMSYIHAHVFLYILI